MPKFRFPHSATAERHNRVADDKARGALYASGVGRCTIRSRHPLLTRLALVVAKASTEGLLWQSDCVGSGIIKCRGSKRTYAGAKTWSVTPYVTTLCA